MAASISERPGKREKDLRADGNKQGERTWAIVDRDAFHQITNNPCTAMRWRKRKGAIIWILC
jgi:hypothetical protein